MFWRNMIVRMYATQNDAKNIMSQYWINTVYIFDMVLALNKFSLPWTFVREASVAVTLRKARCTESKKVRGQQFEG